MLRKSTLILGRIVWIQRDKSLHGKGNKPKINPNPKDLICLSLLFDQNKKKQIVGCIIFKKNSNF